MIKQQVYDKERDIIQWQGHWYRTKAGFLLQLIERGGFLGIVDLDNTLTLLHKEV